MSDSPRLAAERSWTTVSWTTAFLRNRYLLVLSLVVILVAGVSALLQLPRLEDPRIVNRNPLLVTLVPGASAERVEALVTERWRSRCRRSRRSRPRLDVARRRVDHLPSSSSSR